MAEEKIDGITDKDSDKEKYEIEVKGEKIQLTNEQVVEAYNKAQDYTPKMQEIAELKALADEYEVSPAEMAGWVKNMNEAELERLADDEKKKGDPPPKKEEDDLDDPVAIRAKEQAKELSELRDQNTKLGKSVESLANMIGNQSLNDQKRDLRKEFPDFDSEDVDEVFDKWGRQPKSGSKTPNDIAKEKEVRLQNSLETRLEKLKTRKAEELKVQLAGGGLTSTPEGKKISFNKGKDTVSPKELMKQHFERLDGLSGP